MKLSAALCGILLFGSVAQGETFTWDAPHTRTDGSPLDPDTQILRYRFFRDGQVGANLEKPNSVTQPPRTIEWAVPVGSHNYFVTTVDTIGNESAPSAVKTYNKAAPTPTSAPTAVPTVAVAPPSAPGNFNGS